MNTIKYNAKIEVSSLNERGDPQELNTIKSEFPSVYFTLRLLTNEIDPTREKYYPTGITNLKNGTKNIKVKLDMPLPQDFKHSSYYASIKRVQVTHNAGDITHLWTTTEPETGLESLYGTSRVGPEHKLYDENNKVVGEAYASAWLTHAQNIINQEQKGSIEDHIPVNILLKYFSDGQLVYPLKSISVEIAHAHYKEFNMTDGNGVKHIFKGDLISVSWLVEDREGQPFSRIEESVIKSIKNMNIQQQNKIENSEANAIKCACEANVGDNVIKNNNVYTMLTKDDEKHEYSLKNIVTDEVINVSSQEEASSYLLASDVENDAKTDVAIKNAIKSCMLCQQHKLKIAEMEKKDLEMQKKAKKDKELNSKKEMVSDVMIPTTADEAEGAENDMTIIMDKLASMEKAFETLTNRIEVLETKAEPTKSLTVPAETELKSAEETPPVVPQVPVTNVAVPQVQVPATIPDETAIKSQEDIISIENVIKSYKPQQQSSNGEYHLPIV